MAPFPVLVMLLYLDQASDKDVSLKVMHQRAQDSRVRLTNGAASELQLMAAPVFRYSDELRQIEDAGVWLWTHHGRPAAAMKVEYYKPGVLTRPWLYCFASLSPELVTAEWDRGPTFQARKPGVTWTPLADKPAATRAARLVQMREIARRFSAEIVKAAEKVEIVQMRLLPRPLYRSEEELADAEDSVLFGFTGTGTNPDLLLLLDLSKEGGWRFGFAGMTAEGLIVRLEEKVVWQRPHSTGKRQTLDNWIYFVPEK